MSSIAVMQANVASFAEETSDRVQRWVDALDFMGLTNNVADLENHLLNAPDGEIEEVSMLRAYIEGLKAAG